MHDVSPIVSSLYYTPSIDAPNEITKVDDTGFRVSSDNRAIKPIPCTLDEQPFLNSSSYRRLSSVHGSMHSVTQLIGASSEPMSHVPMNECAVLINHSYGSAPGAAQPCRHECLHAV